jgi:hypothetical protein
MRLMTEPLGLPGRSGVCEGDASETRYAFVKKRQDWVSGIDKTSQTLGKLWR